MKSEKNTWLVSILTKKQSNKCTKKSLKKKMSKKKI